MAAEGHPQYPPGLDKVAEHFGISATQLVEQIANGELKVIRPDDEEDELTQEDLLEGFRQGWHEALTGQTIPAHEVLAALRKTEQNEDKG